MEEMQTQIELLRQNDRVIEDKISTLQENQKAHMETSKDHEVKDQQRHIEQIQSSAEIKELIITKMMSVEKYIDVKMKEFELKIDADYAKKHQHVELVKDLQEVKIDMDKRITKIESVFNWTWKIVFGFIILGILGVLFGQQK